MTSRTLRQTCVGDLIIHRGLTDYADGGSGTGTGGVGVVAGAGWPCSMRSTTQAVPLLRSLRRSSGLRDVDLVSALFLRRLRNSGTSFFDFKFDRAGQSRCLT